MVANTQGKDSVAPWNNSVAPLKSLAFRLGAAAPLTRCFPALFSFFLELFNKQQGRLLELQILGQGKHAYPLEEIKKNPIKEEMQLDHFGLSKAITI